jgi:hypothetical protein
MPTNKQCRGLESLLALDDQRCLPVLSEVEGFPSAPRAT